IVGELRTVLARVCVKDLEPDLVILDEFQRFKDLLHGDDFAAELARALFTYAKEDSAEHARVLLLSATPYKMFTQHDEATGDDHLKDFLQTVRFLHDDPERTERFASHLGRYGRSLLRYQSVSRSELCESKAAIETGLKEVMVRTERLAVTANRNGMLVEVPAAPLSLEPADLTSYLALQGVAGVVNHGDTMEFWKSAPYALNFMDDYQLKQHFKRATESAESEKLFQALANVPESVLSREDLEAYRAVDPANSRLRWLLHETVQAGAAEMFWTAASCPYYEPEGAFTGEARITKRLVFSAWQVVPKVVASMVSFEAERRLLGAPPEGQAGANTPAERKKRRGLLRFGVKDGRPTGMPALALLYPSPALAMLGDPLTASRELGATERLPSLSEVLGAVQARVRASLAEAGVPEAAPSGGDEKWYWAAPVLLDLAKNRERTVDWFGQGELSRRWQGDAPATGEAGPETEAGEEPDRWSAHVEEARRILVAAASDLGPPPSDLPDVLALLAVGGLANAALRALSRVAGGPRAMTELGVRNAAGQIAHGLRSLFNQPEVTVSLRRSDDDQSYWRRVSEYAAMGCLSAVLDEYAHVALEADTLAGKPADLIAAGIAERMISALTLQTATLRADVVTLDSGSGRVRVDDTFGFRTAFAVRYGARGEEGAAADRNQRLQVAFNSPFWPFVLCTTSVGQEGLDFHSYCHAVVHWNLPSNPVDLEQREGRVHRYKGHAVRKNVASCHRAAALAADAPSDPWAAMFDAARASVTTTDSDLVPYWVYCVDGGAQIERHVPALPLSKDAARKEALRRSLTLYRMAFGQSRQEDVVAFLQRNVPSEDQAQLMADLAIDLAPPRSENRTASGADEVGEWAEEAPRVLESVNPVPPQHSRSLARFCELLDDLNALQESRPDRSEDSGEPSDLATISTLLDEFARIRDAELQASPAGERAKPPIDPLRLADLLDAFVACRPDPVVVGDPRNRFIDLLEQFVRMAGRSGHASSKWS
ncbi:MAG: hypothetical protein H0X67_10115, partial [Acidobacteria bacterium]|nr:hypothetical protein [Acidobacteriota bacterium]